MFSFPKDLFSVTFYVDSEANITGGTPEDPDLHFSYISYTEEAEYKCTLVNGAGANTSIPIFMEVYCKSMQDLTKFKFLLGP